MNSELIIKASKEGAEIKLKGNNVLTIQAVSEGMFDNPTFCALILTATKAYYHGLGEKKKSELINLIKNG